MPTLPRVLCTSLGSEAGPHFEILADAGFEAVVVDRTADLWDGPTLARQLAGSVGVIAGSEPYTPAVLDAVPELRTIARTGVGFDAIDVPACNARGVVVTTTPGVNHEAVAEHTIALLLAVARDFPRQDLAVRRGDWVRRAFPRVQGSTLTVIGLGRIGRAVAWRAVGLGMQVVAYEPHPDGAFCDQWGIKVLPLDEAIAAGNYVSLHCPATSENRHLINAERLAAMQPGAILLNTARGPLVDEAALIAALRSGHLAGAGLDVFETEPLPLTSPLVAMENVVLSGHIAGLDAESHHDSFALAAENILLLSRDQMPLTDHVQNGAGLIPRPWTR